MSFWQARAVSFASVSFLPCKQDLSILQFILPAEFVYLTIGSCLSFQQVLSTLQSTYLFQCDEELREVPNSTPDRVPNSTPERVPNSTPDRVPNSIPDRVPSSTPDTFNSKHIPRQGPDTWYMFPEGAKAEVRS